MMIDRWSFVLYTTFAMLFCLQDKRLSTFWYKKTLPRLGKVFLLLSLAMWAMSNRFLWLLSVDIFLICQPQLHHSQALRQQIRLYSYPQTDLVLQPQVYRLLANTFLVTHPKMAQDATCWRLGHESSKPLAYLLTDPATSAFPLSANRFFRHAAKKAVVRGCGLTVDPIQFPVLVSTRDQGYRATS